MNNYYKNRQEIKKGNQLCFAHLEMPENLWAIEDCVNEEGVLEDYMIMEKKI